MDNQTLLSRDSFGYLDTLLSGYVGKILFAIFILFLGLILGNLVTKILQRVLNDLNLNRNLKKLLNINLNIEGILSYFVKYFIYFIALMAALDQLGVRNTILYMLTGALLIILILSVFLGIKDIIPNFMAGVFVKQKDYIKKGDLVKIQGIEGTVESVDTLQTIISTKKDDMIYVPNSLLSKEVLLKRLKK